MKQNLIRNVLMVVLFLTGASAAWADIEALQREDNGKVRYQVGNGGVTKYDDGDDLQAPCPPLANAEVGEFVSSSSDLFRLEEPADQDNFDNAAGYDADVVCNVVCQIQEVQTCLCYKQE